MTYYKYNSDSDIQPAPNVNKKVTWSNGTTAFGAKETELNQHNYYKYVEPVLPEFKKEGTLYKSGNTITRYVIDMTETEKRIIQLNWQFPDMNIRVTSPKDFSKSAGGQAFINKMLVNDFDKFYISDADNITDIGYQYLHVIEQADYDYLISQKTTYPEIDIVRLNENINYITGTAD